MSINLAVFISIQIIHLFILSRGTAIYSSTYQQKFSFLKDFFIHEIFGSTNIYRVSSRIFGLGGKVASDFTGSTLSVLVFDDF